MKRSLAAVSAALLTSGMLTCVATAAHAAPAAPAPDTAPAARAESLLRSNPGTVQGASGEAYRAVRTKVDANGAAHTSATPGTYHGLRVYGGDFVVHTAPERRLRRLLGRPVRPARRSAPPPRSPAAAAKTAGPQGVLRHSSPPSARRSCSSTPAPARAGSPGRPSSAAGRPTGRPRPGCTSSPTPPPARIIGAFDEIESVVGTGTRHLLRHRQHRHDAVRRDLPDDRPVARQRPHLRHEQRHLAPAPRSPTPTTSGATAPTPTASPPASTPTSARPRRSTTSRTSTAATASSATAPACPAGSTTAATTSTPSGTAPR